MYFSEQGNVDDDATFITIFLVSFNLQSCCLMQSAVCSLRSAVYSLQSTVCSLRSAVCSLQSAVYKCHTPISLRGVQPRVPCFALLTDLQLKLASLRNSCNKP